MFENRAKLYRFYECWKEQGVGIIKILKNKTTLKTRILMRTDLTDDHIMKMIANNLNQPEIASENEVSLHRFFLNLFFLKKN